MHTQKDVRSKTCTGLQAVTCGFCAQSVYFSLFVPCWFDRTGTTNCEVKRHHEAQCLPPHV